MTKRHNTIGDNVRQLAGVAHRSCRVAHVEEWFWQLLAAGRGLPSSVFYPSDNERGNRRRRREHRAKRICHDCPVVADCLKHALAWPENHGAWRPPPPPSVRHPNRPSRLTAADADIDAAI